MDGKPRGVTPVTVGDLSPGNPDVTLRGPNGVAQQAPTAADLYGLSDRGRLVPGTKADVNVIDFDALQLHRPQLVADLPGGAKRLLQRADGYHCTINSGEVTFENGEDTGARPGVLVRGSR